jgi:hypothetical protein
VTLSMRPAASRTLTAPILTVLSSIVVLRG